MAFLSDVHLLDIYGKFSDNDYRGVLNPTTGKYTLARTMQSQLESTRLFNENYFAFKAALNDLVKRGVKYAVLPGDFSDDGQKVNVRALKDILISYANKHNINFILTTGNHDPVKPFYEDGGKKDFLGEEGKQQAIFSRENIFISKDSGALPAVITKDIGKLGYKEILQELKFFGFQPNEETVYWETPFTNYLNGTYSYQKALSKADISNRTYKIQPNLAEVPDLSYLIELGNNIWFLAIDGNVYLPGSEEISYSPNDFKNASVGYNNVLTHKAYLLNWVQSVTKRAHKLGKTLIVFSHYPTVDFNDGATNEIRSLFGEDKMQLDRVPTDEVAKALSEAGVKVHFGGHMHINDTGLKRFSKERSLINIQVPSLAAYIPAYKLLTLKSNELFEVETIILDSVAGFNELFSLYKEEYNFLKENNEEDIWNQDILKSSSYKEFTEWHLRELVRFRFLKSDWPEGLKNILINKRGKELITFAESEQGDIESFYSELLKQDINLNDFEEWTGLDMVNDFYKIKNADNLAIMDVGKIRINQYIALSKLFKSTAHREFSLFGTIFLKFCNGQPANHFQIDLKSGEIMAINPLNQ
ncbi:metallophosphoesterase [Flavobacteriaceae bacterium SZ-1-7]|uniref:metallophosphoesterase n=1 Tax=Tamlana sedimenti TaxID=3134126 RepID=UPI0031238C73